MSTRIVVCGAAGRMGRAVATIAEHHADIVIAGGVDQAAANLDVYPRIVGADRAAELIATADVVVDFSAPGALRSLLEASPDAFAGKGIVVGTTGMDAQSMEALQRAESASAVLVAANFSIGVNLLLALAEQAARVLGPDAFDVEIVEAHHRRKIDAPSGTALALGQSIAQARGRSLDDLRVDGRSGEPGARPTGEIGFHALRGGDIVGEHRAYFIGAGERVELAHVATDRALFAEGALRAAGWIAGKPAGRYTMRQVLGL